MVGATWDAFAHKMARCRTEVEMEKTEQMQQFSLAFVYAIAAQAGCNHSEPAVDDHSVDLTLSKNMSGHLWDDPEIKIQMKSTHQNLRCCDGVLKYDLHNIKNYNDLRKTNLQIQRILVLVRMPENPNDWIHYQNDHIELYRDVYWVSLKGLKETKNTAGVTIDIPISQRFDATELMRMMTCIADGEEI